MEKREVMLRRILTAATILLLLLCAVMSLFFLLNREHFTSWDLEVVMGQMLAHTLPWIVLAFGTVIAAAFVCRRSMEREINQMRVFPAKKYR